MTKNLCYPLLLLLITTAPPPVKAETNQAKHENHPTNPLLDEEHEAAHTDFYYTCPMHRQVRESSPGRCPICNMNLVRVDLSESDDKNSMAGALEREPNGSPSPSQIIARVKLRKAQMSHFRPSFFPVTKMKMSKRVRLLGNVLQTEERESFIPARIEGRVEDVYVQSTGSFVRKGDPVIRIYSPKLITTGEEYIISRKSYTQTKKSEFKALMAEAKQRLRLWGIRDRQIDSWYNAGKVPNKITIYSPETGIVSKRSVTVGKYLKEGQNLFELYDLSEVWVEMDIYEHDAGIVKLGQTVKLQFTALPGEIIEGKVDFINPVLDTKSRTLKVRTTIGNDTGALKPGMIADATLHVDLEGEPLVVPRTAIIDTGKRKVVWKKKEGQTFEAIVVLTGNESEGYVEVKQGLKEGDAVVIDGNFLLDAQAQLFGGYSDLAEMPTPAGDPHSKHQHP